MKIQEVIGIATVTTIIVVGAVLVLDGGEPEHDCGNRWRDYKGFNEENLGSSSTPNKTTSAGTKVGDYLTAIDTRLSADSTLESVHKDKIKTALNDLQTKRIKGRTNAETYWTLIVAERHSAVGHWRQVWKRLDQLYELDSAGQWGTSYIDPNASNLDLTVEDLLNQIKGDYGSNSSILAKCDVLMEAPHRATFRNASWARIALAVRFGANQAGLVDQELDHPEG